MNLPILIAASIITGLILILGSFSFLSYYVIRRLLDRQDKLTTWIMTQNPRDYVMVQKHEHLAAQPEPPKPAVQFSDFIPIDQMSDDEAANL